ncbi:MAG: PHP domain-containing protein, partial [Promethearchaeota archaeon]
MHKFDPHVHTRFSDGTIFYNGVADLKTLARKNNITAFCMTDHDNTRGHKFAKHACKKIGLPFIPGVEISTKEGHVCAYGIDRWEHSAYSLHLLEAIEELEALGSIIVVAHPYDPRMGIKDLLLKPAIQRKIHGFELLNGASPTSNPKTIRVSKRFLSNSRLARYSGSDCHSSILFSKFYIELDCNSNRPEDILESMRKARNVRHRGFFFNMLHW